MTKARGSADKASGQSKRFVETARQLGADEDEDAFDAKLKAVAGQKPRSEKDEAPQRPEKGDKEF